jgi:hypothetical protein
LQYLFWRATAPESSGRPGETPSATLANKHLLEQVRSRLSPTKRYLFEQRALGREWDELADELKKGADALRKQYTRALERVTRELGLGTRNPRRAEFRRRVLPAD